MARAIDISRDPAISTNYNKRYSICNFIPVEELEYENGHVEQRLDLLNWSMVTLLHRITDWKPHRYDGTEPITTISYKSYGTTTLWWVILMYNGYAHSLEIPEGVLLKLPQLEQIDGFLNELDRKRNRGQNRTVLI